MIMVQEKDDRPARKPLYGYGGVVFSHRQGLLATATHLKPIEPSAIKWSPDVEASADGVVDFGAVKVRQK